MLRDTHHIVPNIEKGGWDVKREEPIEQVHIPIQKKKLKALPGLLVKIKELNLLYMIKMKNFKGQIIMSNILAR